jgi:hypothetical protein
MVCAATILNVFLLSGNQGGVQGNNYSVGNGSKFNCPCLHAEYNHRKNINPISYTAWLDNHALTFKSTTTKYYFVEKSSILHTFLNFGC